MISSKIKSAIFEILKKFRNKKVKNLEVTSFNSLALFPDVSYFKSYEEDLFKKIVSGKIHGNVISMGSCFSEQIGFLLSKSSPNQYKMYENTDTNRFYFNADWGRIYSPVSFLELLKFYNGKEKTKIPEIPLSVSSVIGERKFKNLISQENSKTDTKTSFIDLYREHLFVSDNETLLIQNLELHRQKAVKAIQEASNIFITFGTLEYWQDNQKNYWPIRPTNKVVKSMEVENKTLSLSEFQDCLKECIEEVKILNPNINIYLFITPVPLYATFTEMSSLERFFYDSSVILLAMRSLISKEKNVSYLPIFESILIDNPIIRENDMRHIIDKKVKSVLNNIL